MTKQEKIAILSKCMMLSKRDDERDEMLADMISDEYGWCVESFEVED